MSDELLRCRALDGGRARLDCYDQLADVVAEGTVITLPVEDLDAAGQTRDLGLPEQSARPDPGLPQPSARPDPGLREPPARPDRGLREPPVRPDRVAASIASMRRLPRGQLEVTLDNGQVWSEIESSSRSRYTLGDLITIERTRMGNYRLRVDETGYTNSVKRVR